MPSLPVLLTGDHTLHHPHGDNGNAYHQNPEEEMRTFITWILGRTGDVVMPIGIK